MKIKFLCMLIIASFSSTVYASKARIQSLQKAAFLVDVQTVFVNPAHVHSIGRLMTFEFGGNTNSATPKAEGGIFDSEFDFINGVYLGHLSQEQKALRSVNGFENQNNPIEVFYARNNWGASLAFSNYEDKTSDVKEQSVTLRFGTKENGTEIFGSLEAFSNAESGNDEYTGGPRLELGYEKEVGQNYYFGTLNWGTAENEVAGTKTDLNTMGLEVGVINRRIKNVYYGTSLSYQKLSMDKDKSALTLPVFAGVETEVNSYTTVRASIVQSVLISQVEDKNQTAPADEPIINKNDTQVAAGVGFKYNQFLLEGVLSASTTGDVNGNAVLSQASLTYNF